MKKFKVHANNLEYLLQKEIEANNSEEAKLKYFELWENGEIEVNESELKDWYVEEVKNVKNKLI